MAKCGFKNLEDDDVEECENPATTTLMKSSGEVVQLCEFHRELLVNLAKGIAAGEVDADFDDAGAQADHWLVKNRIPS